MKNTNRLISSSVLLLLSTLTAPLIAGGDSRVYSIDFQLGESDWINGLLFSGDGSTIAYSRGEVGKSWIFTDQGSGWNLRQHIADDGGYGVGFFGMSDDGSVLGTWSFTTGSYRIGTDETTPFPTQWDEIGVRDLKGRALSGDGQTASLTGWISPVQYGINTLWGGGDNFTHVTGFQNTDAHNTVTGLSRDGSVAVGTSHFVGPMNNRPMVDVDRESWVWHDNQITVIPKLDLGFDITSNTIGVSGNGEAVIGFGFGIWDAPDPVLGNVYGETHSWIWSEVYGTVEISNAELFSSVRAIDITDDGTTVLGVGSYDGVVPEYFLWTRDNGFVMIEDLFESLSITMDADSYRFSQISGDGTKLMGTMEFEGRQSAIIVSIPAPSTAVLSLLGVLYAVRRVRQS